LWLTGMEKGTSFYTNNSPWVLKSEAKFRPSTPGEHFQIGGWIKRGLKKCAFFNGKLATSGKRWEIRL